LEYLALAGIPRGKNSNIYVVDPTTGVGSDSNDGDRWGKPLATVSAAYAKCVSGQHDTVLLVASAQAVNELARITWSKNLTHLVGLGARTHVAQRTRITCGYDQAASTYAFLTVSAYGCIFDNLYIWQGRDDADSLRNVDMTGQRNLFHNVHFAGGGHATQAVDGGASVYINGGSENLFDGCTIGVDTVDAATGMAALVFAATGGAARNVFRRCRFTLQAGHAGAIFVEVLGNSGIDRYQIFDRCQFINLSGTAMTQAIAVAAGFDANNKRLLLEECSLLGATDWEANDRGAVYLSRGTITAGGNAGILQASAVT